MFDKLFSASCNKPYGDRSSGYLSIKLDTMRRTPCAADAEVQNLEIIFNYAKIVF